MDAPAESTAPDPALTLPLERPRAELDWATFVDAYGRAILDWFGQTNLPTEDSRKIVRTFFAFMCKEFSDISGESALRFRAWLQYAAHIGWCRTMEVLVEKHSSNSHSPLVALLLSNEAHDSFLHALDDECSRLRRRELLVRVQAIVSAPDWQAFYSVVLEGKPESDVALERGAPEHTVRAAVHRVHSLLQEDLQKMEEAY